MSADLIALDRAMRRRDRIALDRASVRTIDQDGHLHVSASPISKANICGYRGAEVPGWRELGLDPDRVYQLLRDPAELADAAETFNGKPLLIQHRPLSAGDHDRGLTVGAVRNVVWRAPYLVAELDVWDGDAIAGIESGERRELSAAYRYDADMTPGTYQGERYDGAMTNLIGNHVALVSEGRAGPDVVVGDAKPEETAIMNANVDKVLDLLEPYRLAGRLSAADLDEVRRLVAGEDDEGMELGINRDEDAGAILAEIRRLVGGGENADRPRPAQDARPRRISATARFAEMRRAAPSFERLYGTPNTGAADESPHSFEKLYGTAGTRGRSL